MNIATKPLLAAKCTDIHALTYPLFASEKIDGIRVICHPELDPVTRKFKPLPNEHIRKIISGSCKYGFDGELVSMRNNKVMDFNTTQSDVMSRGGKPSFMYFVFDSIIDVNLPYHRRLDDIRQFIRRVHWDIQLVTQYTMASPEDVQRMFVGMAKIGAEGIMLRSLDGIYKSGRSTEKQQIPLKMKEMQDTEETIVGFEELMHNDNEATTNLLGESERSSHKGNKVPGGMLGKFIVESKEFGKFRIGQGEGLTHSLRQTIWDNQSDYIGKVITFTYQSHGMKDKRVPRKHGDEPAIRHPHCGLLRFFCLSSSPKAGDPVVRRSRTVSVVTRSVTQPSG